MSSVGFPFGCNILSGSRVVPSYSRGSNVFGGFNIPWGSMYFSSIYTIIPQGILSVQVPLLRQEPYEGTKDMNEFPP
jgi:hypothetical protein